MVVSFSSAPQPAVAVDIKSPPPNVTWAIRKDS